MNAYIGNTDYDWYTFLASRPDLDEVNFWRPGGGTAFRVLSPGEPFFFKLKQAHGHKVVGMAFFVMFRRLTVRDAWDLFGESNGARSQAEMLTRVRRYAEKNKVGHVGLQHEIGAVLLASPVFLPKPLWIDGPSDWKGQIVSGKGLDTTRGEGRRIWNVLLERVQLTSLSATAPTTSDWYRRLSCTEPRRRSDRASAKGCLGSLSAMPTAGALSAVSTPSLPSMRLTSFPTRKTERMKYRTASFFARTSTGSMTRAT
jgi:putative restriction endonuclease